MTTPQDTPPKAPRKVVPVSEYQARFDGWANILTQMGYAGRDKRMAGRMTATLLEYEQLEQLWRGDDVAARAIEVVPREMLRQGFGLRIPDDKKVSTAKKITAQLDDLKASERLYDGLCNERAFGGGAVLVGADDGASSMMQPLNLKALKAVRWLTALNKQEVYAEKYYEDPAQPRFGEVEFWRIQPQMGAGASVTVHESRLLLFKGICISRRQVYSNQGWGDSVLLRAYETIRDFAQGYGGAAALLQDFSQAVYQIEGLSDLIADNQDNVIQERFRIMELARSILRAVVIDKEETFERKTTNLTGLSDILDKFMVRLAAALEMPVTLLMGQSPAGLNATGDSDIRWFYDSIKSKQNNKLKPPLEHLIRLLFLSKEGPTSGKEPESWQVEFNPLWQLTAMEEAEMRNKQANTDKTYIDAGVLTADEVAHSRFGGEKYSTDTVLDLEERRKRKAEEKSALALPKGEPPTPAAPPKNGALAA